MTCVHGSVLPHLLAWPLLIVAAVIGWRWQAGVEPT